MVGQLSTSVGCMQRGKPSIEAQRRLDPTDVLEKTEKSLIAATSDLDLPLTTCVAEQVLIYCLHQ
jgi:hypothetical protein